MRCATCNAPSQYRVCGECRDEERQRDKAQAPTPHNFRLPLEPPPPPGWRFCACGSLSNLSTWQGVTRCAPCWRRAA